MKLKELYPQVKPGDIVYKIENADISPWIYLGPHPKYGATYQGFGSNGNVKKSTFIFTESIVQNDDWQIGYEDAKEEMWRQLMRKVDAVNKIYFDGKKTIL